MAQSAMIHLHDRRPADSEMREMQGATRALAEWIRSEAREDEAMAHDAFQESVEASLLAAVLARRPLPGPDELGVAPEIYLQGLGDVVGEMRRLILSQLHQGDLARADELLGEMEQMFRTLMRFDTTRAIVQLKPKQDTARSLLERTRGEVTMAHLLARSHPSSPAGGPP